MKDGFHAKISLSKDIMGVSEGNSEDLGSPKIVLEWVKVIDGVITETVHKEEFALTPGREDWSYISQGYTVELGTSPASMCIDGNGKRHFTIEANTGVLGVIGLSAIPE